MQILLLARESSYCVNDKYKLGELCINIYNSYYCEKKSTPKPVWLAHRNTVVIKIKSQFTTYQNECLKHYIIKRS